MKSPVEMPLFTAAAKSFDLLRFLIATVGENDPATIVERAKFFALKGVIEQGGMLPFFEGFLVYTEQKKRQEKPVPPDLNYDKTIFANNLKFYMQLNRMRGTDLAKRLNVSPSIVTEWRNARKLPRMDKIQAMAALFNVGVEDLLVGKNTRSDEDENTTHTGTNNDPPSCRA